MAVVAAFNVFLEIKMDSVPDTIVRRLKAAEKVDFLFLGNSVMAGGLKPDVFEKGWSQRGDKAEAFNAALGWSGPVEHYLLARQSYLRHPKIPYVVYGFLDFQLTNRPLFGWEDLEGNKAMSYGFEPVMAAEVYDPGSFWTKARFLLIGAVPMLRQHSQLWKYVELARQSLEELGMPKVAHNQYGRVEDFRDLMVKQGKADCVEAVAESVPLTPGVDALLRLARERGSKLIVVEMPGTSEHRSRLYDTPEWRSYRAYLQRLLGAEGAYYITASDWIPDDKDFRDSLHMNENGAKAFSAKLAEVIGETVGGRR